MSSSDNAIQVLEKKIYDLSIELSQLKKEAPLEPVPDYEFKTVLGKVRLSELIHPTGNLLMIHNMGQGCRYCTLWADGFNAFLPHLESILSVALCSKDSPADQKAMANSRGWRFTMVSHGGGTYSKEQSVMPGHDNMPGVVYYEQHDKQIFRKNASVFGPYDQYCSIWHLLAMAGIGAEEWTPQFRYWQRPKAMDDGGENLNE